MNYRDLVNRLEAIESRVDEADDARAQYDQFKADDAKAGAIEQVKKYASIPLNQIPRLANAIDPKTGIIYYGDAGGEGGGSQPKKMPLKFMSQGDQKPMVDAIKAAGLEVVPHEEKTLFGGTAQYAKVDAGKLASVMAGIQPVAADAGQGAKPQQPRGGEFVKANLAKLAELVAKLEATKKPMESTDYDIANQLIESFGYETNEDATTSLGKAALGGAGKTLAKALPGVGLALGAKDAYDRFQKGDYTGAGIAGLSGVTSLIPGIGTAATLGLDAANLARDYKRGEFDSPATAAAPAQAAKPVRAGDPKVMALQKQLIAKGAKIQADGIMGPATQAAMKQFPLSVAENIALLRDQLAMLETKKDEEDIPDEEVNEFIDSDNDEQANEDEQTNEAGEGSLLKGAWNAGKNFMGGLKGAPTIGVAKTAAEKEAEIAARIAAGTKSPKSISDVKKITGLEKGANTAGKAVAKNPVKTALGGAALGAGAGLALGGAGAAAKPERPTGGAGGKPVAPAEPTGPAATGLTPEQQELIKQIQATMGTLADVEDPAVVAGLQTAQSAISRFGDNKPQSAMDNATAAAAQSAALAAPTPSNATANTTGGPNMAQVNKPGPTSGQAAKPVVPGATDTKTTKSGTTVSNW
jgi:hypothetical protein